MSFTKKTSIAALGALLMLGAPAFANDDTPSDSSPSGVSRGPEAGTSESGFKDQSKQVQDGKPVLLPGEGRNTTITSPGDARAAGSGNGDTDRRDCTGTQTPC